MAEITENSTLLFACGNPATKSLLHPMLQSFGFQSIIVAKDQEAASGAVRFNRLTMVIAEHKGEQVDGEKLARFIRAQDTPNTRVPILLVAEQSDGALDNAAIEAGASAIVELPFEIKAFYRTIKAVLDKVPGIIHTAKYVGPERRDPENRPSHNKDRRRERGDIPSPAIDTINEN